MTNEEFWQKLDILAPTCRDVNNLREFALLLKQGYEEDLCLPTAGLLRGNLFNQAYIPSSRGRLLLCFTNLKSAVSFKERGIDGRAATWFPLKVRDILNNMFNKGSIAGLAFNPRDEKNVAVVPKILLEEIMPGPKPKPESLVNGE